MIDGRVNVQALHRRAQVTVFVEVVANRALAIDCTAYGRTDGVPAARITDGIGLELAGRVPDRVGETESRHCRDHIELAPERVRRVVEEARVARPGGVGGDETSVVGISPARVVLRTDTITIEPASEYIELGTTFIEGLAEFGVYGLVVAREIFVVRVASANIETFEIALNHRIKNTGHRIGAVDGRGAIAKHFDTIDAVGRDHVGVDAVHGDKAAANLFGLVLRRVHNAATIKQRQRIARAETAQIEPADVTAR